MSGNKNNRAGNGKHPNSPRYSEKYGKGHMNPYLGAQPRQEELFREIEERQNAVRRENEQDARTVEDAHLADGAQSEENGAPGRAARSTARKRTRDYSQPRVMDNPQMKKRLREIQEQAMNEAKAFRSSMYPNGEDFDEGDLSPDIKMKLSEDNKPLIALESRGRDGRLEIKWIPVVLSDEDMETFFPAIEPTKDSRVMELEDNNELRRTDDNLEIPDEDGLILIPIAGLEEEPPEEDGTAPGTATEKIDVPHTADTDADVRASIIEELPFVEFAPQDDKENTEQSEQLEDLPVEPESEPEESTDSVGRESEQDGEDASEQTADEEQIDSEQEESDSGEIAVDAPEENPESETSENEAQTDVTTEQRNAAEENGDGPVEEVTHEAGAEAAADKSDEEKEQTAPDGEECQQSVADGDGEPERKKHKRRRSRPTDVQMPVELSTEEVSSEEEQSEAAGEEESVRIRRTAVVSRMSYDGMVDDSSGQDDTLFLRRKRPGMMAVHGQGMVVQSPRYINDDDFVERWLGNEEEEDMASDSKRRRRRISTLIGAVTMVLALIGFIAVAKWGIGLLSGIGNTDGKKTEYAEFISPIVMSEVPVFEAWDAIPQDKLLQSAVFSVLLEMDVSYERDDTGKFIIPSTDIVNAVKTLYGAYSEDPTRDEEINTQIRNALYGSAGEDTTNTDVYYVDLEDSFHVADGLSGPAPQVVDISRRDNSITLTVQYLEDLEGGSGGILYTRQYILTLSGDGYYVQAIREYDE